MRRSIAKHNPPQYTLKSLFLPQTALFFSACGTLHCTFSLLVSDPLVRSFHEKEGHPSPKASATTHGYVAGCGYLTWALRILNRLSQQALSCQPQLLLPRSSASARGCPFAVLPKGRPANIPVIATKHASSCISRTCDYHALSRRCNHGRK